MFNRLSDASKGAVFLVSGISIFGFSDNLTLLVSDNVSVGQFHFSRSLIAMFMVIIAARLFGMPVLAKLWKPTAARTVFMVTSMLLYFGAMPMMPIAEAGAGLFTSPIFVLLFSAILFGERIGFRRILAVLVGSVGVWCVLQPGADGVTIYQLMPILAGACYAIGSIITFRYLQDESAFAILFSFLVTTKTFSKSPVLIVASYVLKITDLPAKSCINLPGNLLASYRAGIIAMTFI